MIGLLVTAILILTILQRVFTGPLNTQWAGSLTFLRGESRCWFLRLR